MTIKLFFSHSLLSSAAERTRIDGVEVDVNGLGRVGVDLHHGGGGEH